MEAHIYHVCKHGGRVAIGFALVFIAVSFPIQISDPDYLSGAAPSYKSLWHQEAMTLKEAVTAMLEAGLVGAVIGFVIAKVLVGLELVKPSTLGVEKDD